MKNWVAEGAASDVNDFNGEKVICNGTALSLSYQCHDEYYDGPYCNYYPLDEVRYDYFSFPQVYRSYLDLCQDNKCVQHYKAEFAKKLLIKVHFFSTCVDEALLCKGIPLCENKNDLKACKMNFPNMDWKPIDTLSTCTTINHPEYIMPYGQKINSDLINDTSRFYCLNRGDTKPFLITNSESNDDDSKTWTQWVNTACDWLSYDRRCLGLRPDICVSATGKYIHITENVIILKSALPA